jgi:hypothetical protein
MSGKNVVVFGANGQVGQGIVFQALKEGATVVCIIIIIFFFFFVFFSFLFIYFFLFFIFLQWKAAVLRDAKKFDSLKEKMPNVQNLLIVQGTLDKDENAIKLRDNVVSAFGKDKHPDHVISSVRIVNATTQTHVREKKPLKENILRLFIDVFCTCIQKWTYRIWRCVFKTYSSRRIWNCISCCEIFSSVIKG